MTAADTEIASGVGLGYRPELDGLRAIAVALVILSHYVGSRLTAGGFLGVDLFFVLSGFLITRLLLEEWRHAGRIRIGAFYGRRVARLLPALALVAGWVALDSVTTQWLTNPIRGTAAGVLGSLFYVANWVQLSGRDLGTLGHAWSLAVEEQFYLVWPAIAVVALRWRGARGVATVAAVALGVAAVQMAVRFVAGVSAEVLYKSTDAHGAVLLMAGCAAAAIMPTTRISTHWTRVASRRVAPPVAVVSLLLVPLSAFDSGFYYVGGFVLVAAGFVALTGRALDGVAWLRLPVLVHVGRLSYGLYLWHPPIERAVEKVSDAPWPAVSVVALAVTVAVAEASYHYVEMPIRRWAAPRLTAR